MKNPLTLAIKFDRVMIIDSNKTHDRLIILKQK